MGEKYDLIQGEFKSADPTEASITSFDDLGTSTTRPVMRLPIRNEDDEAILRAEVERQQQANNGATQ